MGTSTLPGVFYLADTLPRMHLRNFNPFLAWSLGASCVALNWQRWDKAMMVNEGKFLENGGCGYVLKPDWMRDARDELPKRADPHRLSVHVFSAFKPEPLRLPCMRAQAGVHVFLPLPLESHGVLRPVLPSP